MTYQEALTLIKVITAAYPRQDLKEDTIKIYVAFLQDLDYKATEQAIGKHIRTSKWFPTIAEIREAVAEATYRLPDAEYAMMVAKAAAESGDYSLIKANPLLVDAVDTIGFYKLQYSEYPEPLYRELKEAYRRMRERYMEDAIGSERLGLDSNRRALPGNGEAL